MVIYLEVSKMALRKCFQAKLTQNLDHPPAALKCGHSDLQANVLLFSILIETAYGLHGYNALLLSCYIITSQADTQQLADHEGTIVHVREQVDC